MVLIGGNFRSIIAYFLSKSDLFYIELRELVPIFLIYSVNVKTKELDFKDINAVWFLRAINMSRMKAEDDSYVFFFFSNSYLLLRTCHQLERFYCQILNDRDNIILWTK